ncbi:MAG: TerC family protein [Candidatus Methanogranum gryphiswaldense]|nr:MAG: TerC family protein [Candidatus Methanogranum sp. U3.2.1]
MIDQTIMWVVFGVIVVVLLALDLGVFNRGPKHIPVRKALLMTAMWVTVALIFAVFVYVEMGSDKATEYLASYAVEKAMSVDNIFVFIVIFSYFAIPDEYQHEALFYGVVGAIVFRAIFIFVGSELLESFHIVMYIFGAILIYTAIKTAFAKEKDQKDSFVVKLCRRIKASPELDGAKLFTVKNGVKMATPLLICIVVIELSDIMFAFDSIPACLSITTDTFIVYTSNIFAIMGLRSLYFALRGTMVTMKYMKYGLGAILIFVGVKMLISEYYEVSVLASLLFILVAFTLTIVASFYAEKKCKAQNSL